MIAVLVQFLPYLLPLVGGLFTWLTASIAAKNKAAKDASRASTALLKLAAIGAALLQKGWEHIGPEVQNALADGKIDESERATIEESVRELLKDATDEATLKEISEALGLPLAGIIAKVASFLIEKWTQAHDPEIVTTSAKTYPTPAMIDAPASPPVPVSLGTGAPDPLAG